MRKLFLLSMIVIILILMASAKTAKAQIIIRICNRAAHREMPEVTWNRLLLKAEEKSPVLEGARIPGKC